MNRQGGQPVRNMSAFGGQTSRSTSQMGSGRLPNGKITGPQGGWPFGGIQNGASGIPPTSRTPLSSASFAQSLGGGAVQSNAPLDPSDFPSLTNNSSSPFPNPSSQASQAVWSTAVRTNAPNTASAGGMGPFSGRLGGHQEDNRQIHASVDAGASNAVGSRTGGHANHGGVSDREIATGQEHLMSANPPAMEEFPPLGGLGSSDLGQDRRVNIMQNAANNGVSSSGAKQQSHEDLLEQSNSPTADSQTTGLDSLIQDGTNSNPSGDGNSIMSKSSGRDPLMDKYGLPELLRRVRSDDPNVQALAIGHDLTTIGLDLSSNEPLWPTWSGPFGTQPARPMTPEFQLPGCYKVNNVRPLQDKIANFNTETLFIIFYQMPGDVAQEYAAYELSHRNWRFHKVHKFWFTRLSTTQAPYPTPDGERGMYEIFNFPLMRRESRQMHIRWADVDDHIIGSGTFDPMIN